MAHTSFVWQDVRASLVGNTFEETMQFAITLLHLQIVHIISTCNMDHK